MNTTRRHRDHRSAREISGITTGNAQGESPTRNRRWQLVAAGTLIATIAVAISACSSNAQPQDVAGAGSHTTISGTVQATRSHVPSAVGASADPAADPSKASYMLTSSTYPIKGDGNLTVQSAACGSGFYVRPTPPPALQPTNGLSPAIWLSVSNGSSFVKISSTTPGQRYWQGNFAPFSSFGVKFHSSTPYSHTLYFSWWCDAVAPWMTSGASSDSSSGLGAKIGPPTPNNPYSSFQSTALTNDSTGLALNNANDTKSEGNPIITWPNTAGADNQAWYFNSSDFLNGIPVFSLDVGNSGIGTTISMIQENSSTHQVALHNSQGSVPAGGSWYYLDTIPGPHVKTAGKLDVMLINTSTNQCLAAPPQQGTQVQTAPCNTTNTSQWWTSTLAKR